MPTTPILTPTASSGRRRHRTARSRFRTGMLTVAAAFAATAVAVPAPAHAHAALVRVAPANGSVSATAPSTVSVTFNEPVATDAKRVQLLTQTGAVVPTRFTTGHAGATITLTPQRRLATGAYALRWSVTSADGHVVTGASAFVVGTLRPGTATSTTVSSGNVSHRLTVSSDRVGAVTVTVPTGTKALEFRHRSIGAAIPAQVLGQQATAVLPAAGTWNITLVLRVSEFSEQRLLGTLRINQAR